MSNMLNDGVIHHVRGLTPVKPILFFHASINYGGEVLHPFSGGFGCGEPPLNVGGMGC